MSCGPAQHKDKAPDVITLVLGGARSGKSAFAEKLIMDLPPPWTYLATAAPHDGDDEMAVRIAAHKARRDARWQTIEAPLDLADTIGERTDNRPLLVDCLSLWLSNCLLAGRNIEAECDGLITALQTRTGPVILVANEVGLGIVPDNALARVFRDAAGTLNQRVAALASDVYFIAAGLPLRLKQPPPAPAKGPQAP